MLLKKTMKNLNMTDWSRDKVYNHGEKILARDSFDTESSVWLAKSYRMLNNSNWSITLENSLYSSRHEQSIELFWMTSMNRVRWSSYSMNSRTYFARSRRQDRCEVYFSIGSIIERLVFELDEVEVLRKMLRCKCWKRWSRFETEIIFWSCIAELRLNRWESLSD